MDRDAEFDDAAGRRWFEFPDGPSGGIPEEVLAAARATGIADGWDAVSELYRRGELRKYAAA